MTDLDKAVCEAVGLHGGVPVQGRFLFSPEALWEWRTGQATGIQGRQATNTFSPSTDLNHAFEAAEKVGLFNHWTLKPHPGIPDQWVLYDDGDYLAVADTPAEAICKAILALKPAPGHEGG